MSGSRARLKVWHRCTLKLVACFIVRRLIHMLPNPWNLFIKYIFFICTKTLTAKYVSIGVLRLSLKDNYILNVCQFHNINSWSILTLQSSLACHRSSNIRKDTHTMHISEEGHNQCHLWTELYDSYHSQLHLTDSVIIPFQVSSLVLLIFSCVHCQLFPRQKSSRKAT